MQKESTKKKVEFTLDWPPSINDYYGTNRYGGRYLKPKTKRYLEGMPYLVKQQCKNIKFVGKVKVDYLFSTPTKGKHDIGNLYKAIDDVMQSSGLIENDNDIYRGKAEKVDRGTVRLIVEEI